MSKQFKSDDFNVKKLSQTKIVRDKKLENADLQTLFDENPIQSTSEFARELNVNCNSY